MRGTGTIYRSPLRSFRYRLLCVDHLSSPLPYACEWCLPVFLAPTALVAFSLAISKPLNLCTIFWLVI
jgi:hypothetical protein